MSHKVFDAASNGVTHRTEGGQSLFITASDGARIRKTPVLLPARAREVGALLGGVIADCHDEVHRRLAFELIERLRAMACRLADVDPNLAHRLDRQRMHAAWMGSRAKDCITAPSASAQEPLGHLRARRIMRAEKQDAHW